jgi:cell volume regulation protein A
MIPIEHLLVAAAFLLLLSILASKLSSRLGIPALLLFLALGMLTGSDGLGGIWFDNPWLAQSLGVVALALILFAGGMDTDWQVVRPAFNQGLALSTVGVLITALSVGRVCPPPRGVSPQVGNMLCAILYTTHPPARFAKR